MKALISAAGRGVRMGSLTATTSKCLLPIGTTTLLRRSVDALRAAGIDDVVVVIGHAADQVHNAVRGAAHTVFNPEYAQSGILVSLLAAETAVGNDDLLILTGDAVYDPMILCRFIDAEGKIAVGVQRKVCDAEAAKVIITDSRIVAMGKRIPLDQTTGEFTGIARLSAETVSPFFALCKRLIDRGNTQAYLMDVLMAMQQDGTPLEIIDVPVDAFTEIDTEDEYNETVRRFRERSIVSRDGTRHP